MFNSEMIALYFYFFYKLFTLFGPNLTLTLKMPSGILNVNKKNPLEKLVQKDILYVAVRCLLIAIY